MAITFAKASKRQIYSIIILIILIIVFIGLMILIMKPSKRVIFVATESVPPPEVNFSILQNPVLLRLEQYPNTPDMIDGFGRSDPFTVLATTTATTTKK